MPIKTNRSNVQSAKKQGRLTPLEQLRANMNRGTSIHKNGSQPSRKYNRKMIQDSCDYCFEYMYMYRFQIGLRLKGRTFMCWACRTDEKNEEEVNKKPAPLPCWITPSGPSIKHRKK